MTTASDATFEVIQLCDEKGDFTRTAIRSEVCCVAKPDFCAVSNIWILNSHGEILCSKRSSNVFKNGGKWQTYFGGHIKPGESYESSALAELKEETGISAHSDDVVFVSNTFDHASMHSGRFYVFLWDGDESEIKSHDDEIDGAKWYTFSIYNLARNSNPAGWCHNISEETYLKCLQALKINPT